MTYKLLEEEAISTCTQNHQSEDASYTKTQQSSKNILGGFIICGILFIVIIVIGLILCLLSWSIPPRTKFNIVEASIVHFNITSNNTLYYNFKVTITAKNFEDAIKSYDKITAIASYKGNQLASVKMAPFKLCGKNIVRLEPIVFEGNNVMIFEPQQLAKYKKETQLEVYNLDLDLDLDYFRSHVHCPNLRVPLISNGKIAPPFNATTCSYKNDY
ncbi:hypothetical protein P8452_73621 [Trifolium repens]|jgi:hypothetical protein|nr:NDR1/HIN1 protein [Trifolium repens]WJX91904.1 hypothetical protein P8452_73621 [Trifolium repens]